EFDARVFQLRRHVVLGDQRLLDPSYVVPEKIAREGRAWLQLQRRAHWSEIETVDRDREVADMRLLSRRDRVNDDAPRAARVGRIGIFRMFYRGVVITAIPQVGLNFVRVFFD